MSEWDRIEKQLGNALEDLFNEILVLFNDQMYAEKDNEWDRFKAECRKRYEAGRAQHSGTSATWDNWTEDDFDENIREELIDYIIYAAARNTRPIRNPS